MKEGNKRKTNLEILRIISMIMIIAYHYAEHSNFNFGNNITINNVIVHILTVFGKLGVAIFIMISGYFYDKSEFKIKKVVNIVLKVWIYSAIGIIIGILTNSKQINPISLIAITKPTLTRIILVC